MKKVFYLSGISTVLLLALFLSGIVSVNDKAGSALRQGNKSYDSGDYPQALKFYEAGLEAAPGDADMRFNAAQAAYMLGEYGKALEYYESSAAPADRFYNAGNLFYGAGEASREEQEKAQFYLQAASIYEEGIRAYPREVGLKYNYELAKAKVEELMENMEQDNEGGDGDGLDQEPEDAEQEEGADGQDGDAEDAPEPGLDDGAEERESSPPDEGEDGLDREAVERILQMLENREEEDLKNNQEVIRGNGDRYGW